MPNTTRPAYTAKQPIWYRRKPVDEPQVAYFVKESKRGIVVDLVHKQQQCSYANIEPREVVEDD